MNTKKIIKYIAVALLAYGTSSCSDFLEKEVDLTLSEEQVFRSYENTRGFLANIYTYLPDACWLHRWTIPKRIPRLHDR